MSENNSDYKKKNIRTGIISACSFVLLFLLLFFVAVPGIRLMRTLNFIDEKRYGSAEVAASGVNWSFIQIIAYKEAEAYIEKGELKGAEILAEHISFFFGKNNLELKRKINEKEDDLKRNGIINTAEASTAPAVSAPVENIIPELTDDNIREYIDDDFNCYSQSRWDFGIECDTGSLIDCQRNSDSAVVFRYYDFDGKDIRIINYGSRDEMEEYLRKHLAGNLLDSALDNLDSFFDEEIIYKKDGNLYYCPNNGIENRGSYDVYLASMKIYKKISDYEYIIAVDACPDFSINSYNDLYTDYYTVSYSDGRFKLSGSDYESEDKGNCYCPGDDNDYVGL